MAAEALGQVTYWAVALLFFLYGAKLDPASVKAGMLNWRLQGLTFAATYLMIPVLGMAFALIFGDLLGPQVTLGLVFLAVLPSTIQSSIAFVSMAGGNVPAAICAASLSNLIGVALTPALVAVLLQTGEGASAWMRCCASARRFYCRSSWARCCALGSGRSCGTARP